MGLDLYIFGVAWGPGGPPSWDTRGWARIPPRDKGRGFGGEICFCLMVWLVESSRIEDNKGPPFIPTILQYLLACLQIRPAMPLVRMETVCRQNFNLEDKLGRSLPQRILWASRKHSKPSRHQPHTLPRTGTSRRTTLGGPTISLRLSCHQKPIKKDLGGLQSDGTSASFTMKRNHLRPRLPEKSSSPFRTLLKLTGPWVIKTPPHGSLQGPFLVEHYSFLLFQTKTFIPQLCYAAKTGNPATPDYLLRSALQRPTLPKPYPRPT
ncbi:hypothetical protein JTE90_016043 [Oedothorax gibbosus]|uniref:Uncharacterized protein n=1 Tax=Oedothorax gibbosus TaxID=931172 RepID=A0AAV6U447_9ARAC|nr:hypothetical protein JTE90_016043 [Oedothorax gibbosus]